MGDPSTSFGLNKFNPSLVPSWETDPQTKLSYLQWLQAGRTLNERYLQYSSFSGADCRCAIWIPPTKNRLTGTYKLWSELQTITISSERPAGPVRTLGRAAVRDYVRGVRTIAGTMIFSVLDRDVFAEVYQQTDAEGRSEYPLYVDEIPNFNIIITATNEMGMQATAVVIDCILTNFGTTFSIDDIMLESTYTYVAKYVHPFVNRSNWRSELANIVSKFDGNDQKLSLLLMEQEARISLLGS